MHLDLFPRKDGKIHLVNTLLCPFFVQCIYYSSFSKNIKKLIKHVKILEKQFLGKTPGKKTRSEYGNFRPRSKYGFYGPHVVTDRNAGFLKAI